MIWFSAPAVTANFPHNPNDVVQVDETFEVLLIHLTERTKFKPIVLKLNREDMNQNEQPKKVVNHRRSKAKPNHDMRNRNYFLERLCIARLRRSNNFPQEITQRLPNLSTIRHLTSPCTGGRDQSTSL
jgi:transcriptional accessory protein Tex/SPT6